MWFKRICCAVMGIVTACLMSGCDIFPTENDELLTAPQLTGELSPIIKALENRIGKSYTLRYPSGGDRRSAVVLKDINADGTDEAFAFYSKGEDDMHLNMITLVGDNWRSVDERKLTAGGIERIDFYDIDNNGTEEILVGWEIYGTTEKQLAVYNATNNRLNLMLLQKYTAYTCCDIDEDEQGEIFLQLLSSADPANRAYIFEKEGDKLTEASSCAMDRNVKSIISQNVSVLSTGQSAIYVDELKSAGAVTEVFFLSQGKLVNPLLDTTGGETLKTERAASLSCVDINRDELLEIPVAEEIPSVTGSTEKCYYTKWCSFNGEVLTTQCTYLINQNDGFYIDFPEKWIGNIAVYRDGEKRIRRFFNINEEGAHTEIIAELRIISISDWDSSGFAKGELTEICRNSKNVIAGYAYSTEGKISITFEELKKIIYTVE